MIGFSVEREACEWAVGMGAVLSIRVCVCVCVFLCTVRVRMFVCEVVVCVPWQEVGATTQKCPCNVSDE